MINRTALDNTIRYNPIAGTDTMEVFVGGKRHVIAKDAALCAEINRLRALRMVGRTQRRSIAKVAARVAALAA